MLLTSDVVERPGTVVIGLPGAGCSPVIFGELRHPAVFVHAVDWAKWPGPWTLESLSSRLGSVLSPRAGPTVLAGVSLGGAIAMLTALAAPDRISGLLISNTGAHVSHHGDPTLPQRVREGWTPEASDAFLRSCFHAAPRPELWIRMREYVAQLNLDAFLQSIESLRSIDLRPHLAGIRCPTVIAHGRHDRRRSIADAMELASLITGAELQLLDAGHTPMVEAPEAYAAALARLLKRCGLAAPTSL